MPKIVRSLDYKNKPRLSSYREGATKRGLPFLLNQADFDMLIEQACHYCGHAKPNGIDRKNNDLGYSVENCVPACLQCNYAKGSHCYDDFIVYLRRVALHQARQACLHVRLVASHNDHCAEVVCLDCDMSAICWQGEHIPETLWNSLVKLDKTLKAREQDRCNYCAICGSEILR